MGAKLVYTKQLKTKLESQRKIYNYLLFKRDHWAPWTELLKAKEVGLSKRALSRNLREMLKPNAEFQLVKQKRPHIAKPLVGYEWGWGKYEKESPNLLYELYVKQDKKADIKGSKEDYYRSKFLKPDAIGIENWSPRRIINYLRKHKRFYRRKEYLKRLKKYFKQFERIGYSIKPPEITHG